MNVKRDVTGMDVKRNDEKTWDDVCLEFWYDRLKMWEGVCIFFIVHTH